MNASEAMVIIFRNKLDYLILADRTGHQLEWHWCIYRCHWICNHRLRMWHSCCMARQIVPHIYTGSQFQLRSTLSEEKNGIYMLLTLVICLSSSRLLLTCCDANVRDVCVVIELYGKTSGIQGGPNPFKCFCIRGIHYNINNVIPLACKHCKDRNWK